MEDFRRDITAKRKVVGFDTPLGHRYSNAIEQRQSMANLERNHKNTLNEIAELELADMF